MVHGLLRGQLQTGPRMTWFVLAPRIICENETIGLGLENSQILHYLSRFKLTFRSRLALGSTSSAGRFPLKAREKCPEDEVALGCCETWVEKVCQRSMEWFERDVPGMHMDEVGFKQKFRPPCVSGHFPATTARVSKARRSGI